MSEQLKEILCYLSIFISGISFGIAICTSQLAHADCVNSDCLGEFSIRKHEEPYKEPKPVKVDRYCAIDWKSDPTVLVSSGASRVILVTHGEGLTKQSLAGHAKPVSLPKVVYVMQKPDEDVKITSWFEEE